RDFEKGAPADHSADPAPSSAGEVTPIADVRTLPLAEAGQTLLVGAPPRPKFHVDERPPAPRSENTDVWLRRAAIAVVALVGAGAAVAGYRVYEEHRASVAAADAEAHRAAEAEQKRRAAEDETRRAAERAAAEAEGEAQAAALRELEAGLVANTARSYDEALRHLGAAIESGKLTVAQHTQALLAKSAAWVGKGDFARAFAETSEAIRVNAESAEAYLERGRIRWHRQEWDNSLADFNEAIRLDPALAESHSLRGIVWYHKGDIDRAIADYDEALRLKPDHADALFNRGLAWHRKGDIAKATEDFRAVLRANPSQPVALNARRMLTIIGAAQ